jgi:hypothetical protein
VLLNGRKHRVSGPGIDPCSSGGWFAGWREAVTVPGGPVPVARARTWLLRVGWRRSGLISVYEMPAGRKRPRARLAHRGARVRREGGRVIESERH